MRRAIIQQLGALSTYRFGVDPYDSTKLGLGSNIFQHNGGGELSYAGLDPLQVVAFERPEDADGMLVRGTLPGLRHVHIWTPKKLCSTHTL